MSRPNRDDENMLDEVYSHLARFIVTPSVDDIRILTLWAAHTWLVDVLPTTPRLQIDSIAPGSGKTTTLEHLERLTRDACTMSTVSSAALLVRMLDQRPRTLLLDEVDRALDPKAELTKDLIAVLNSGYKRGASRPVLVPGKEGNWDVKEMSTYAPVVLSGNSPRLPDDTLSRIIRIVLMPDAEGRAEETNWEDLDKSTRKLGRRLKDWCATVQDEVRTARPELPAGCIGRNRERWAPLMRVALAAGGNWPGYVRALIHNDLEEQEMLREEGLHRVTPAVRLMLDIQAVFTTDRRDLIPTRQLIAELIRRNPAEWSSDSAFGRDLTAQRLGRMLTQSWRIHSRRNPDGSRERGYHRADFAAAWRQVKAMLPAASPASPGSSGS